MKPVVRKGNAETIIENAAGRARAAAGLMAAGVVAVMICALAGCASSLPSAAAATVKGDIGCRVYAGGTEDRPLTVRIAPPGEMVAGYDPTPMEEEYGDHFFKMVIEDPSRGGYAGGILLEPYGRTLVTADPRKMKNWYPGRTITQHFTLTRLTPDTVRIQQKYIGVHEIGGKIRIHPEKRAKDLDYSGTYVCADRT